jgi:hypothetical protein
VEKYQKQAFHYSFFINLAGVDLVKRLKPSSPTAFKSMY